MVKSGGKFKLAISGYLPSQCRRTNFANITYLESIRDSVQTGLHHGTRRIPVVLHPNSILSNGFVYRHLSEWSWLPLLLLMGIRAIGLIVLLRMS